MAGLMKNTEFRSAAAQLLAFMAAAAAVLLLLCMAQTGWLQGKTADQFAAAIGNVTAAHPELEQEIVAAFVSPAKPADIARGKALLQAYGYGADTPLAANPVLSGALPATLIGALAFVAVFAAGALLLTARGYAVIYRKVGAIAEAAEKVVDGNFGALLPAVGEGEFDVLGHRFNQMANRLKRNVEQLTREKVFLKNTISDISHQLKTPLSTLVVTNDLMAEQEGMDPARRREFLEVSRQQLQRLEWLIQSLLKMARLEAGSIAFRREPVALKAVAEEACAGLSATAAEAGVALAIEERRPGAVYTGDGDWLVEAVINIVKNGVEHSAPGGMVTVAIDDTPLIASVTVADRGEGIDAADLPHIFERFYRGSRSVKPNSVGIGLALSKAIVEGQGGTISVKSDKGRGSEFTIVFLKTIGETKKIEEA